MAAPKHGQLVLGNEYLSVVCPSCTNVIPVAQAGEIYSPTTSDRKLTFGCPFCGLSAEHPVSDIEIRRLQVLPPTAQ
jgi:hypothetical protein